MLLRKPAESWMLGTPLWLPMYAWGVGGRALLVA